MKFIFDYVCDVLYIFLERRLFMLLYMFVCCIVGVVMIVVFIVGSIFVYVVIDVDMVV